MEWFQIVKSCLDLSEKACFLEVDLLRHTLCMYTRVVRSQAIYVKPNGNNSPTLSYFMHVVLYKSPGA